MVGIIVATVCIVVVVVCIDVSIISSCIIGIVFCIIVMVVFILVIGGCISDILVSILTASPPAWCIRKWGYTFTRCIAVRVPRKYVRTRVDPRWVGVRDYEVPEPELNMLDALSRFGQWFVDVSRDGVHA